MITGALGITGTAVGDARALAGLNPGEGATLWALKTVATHPLRYIRGVASRIGFACSIRPLLLLFALCGWLLYRRRSGVAEVALLALFFLLVHCLMTVEERYFVPLWFIAAALASGLITVKSDISPGDGAAALSLRTCLWITGPLAAAALLLVIRFPLTSNRGDLKALADAHPDNSWLLRRYGDSALAQGNNAAALQALERAYRLDPKLSVCDYGTALLITGEYRRAENAELDAYLSAEGIADGYNLLILMLMKLEEGDLGQAKALLERYTGHNSFIRLASGNYERRMQQEMLEKDMTRDTRMASDLMMRLPPEREIPLGEKLKATGLYTRGANYAAYAALKKLGAKDGVDYGRSSPALISRATGMFAAGGFRDDEGREMVDILSSPLMHDGDNLLLMTLFYLENGDYAAAREMTERYAGKPFAKLDNAGKNRINGILAEMFRKLPFGRMCLISSRLPSAGIDPEPVMYGVYPEYPPKSAELYAKSRKLTNDGDLAGAATLLEKVLALNPNHLGAYRALGEICVKRKNAAKAAALYEKALQLNAKELRSPLLDAMRRDAPRLRALMKLDTDGRHYENDTNALLNYALSLLKKNDNGATWNTLLDGIEVLGDKDTALALNVLMHTQKNDSTALRALLDSPETDKNNLKASLAGLLLRLPKERLLSMNAALQRAGMDIREELGPRLIACNPEATARAADGNRDTQSGRLSKARGELEKTILLNSYCLPAYSALADVYAKQKHGEIIAPLYRREMEANRDVQPAAKLDAVRRDAARLETLMKLDTGGKHYESDPDALLAYAVSLLLKDDNGGTWNTLLEGMKALGDNDTASALRIMMLAQKNDFAAARALLPSTDEGRRNLQEAAAALLLKLPQQRLISLNSALRSAGLDERHALGEFAASYNKEAADLSAAGVRDAQAGRLEQAQRELQKAVELNPYCLPAYSTLAAVYTKQKHSGLIGPLYKKAIELNRDLQSSPLMDMIEADYAAIQKQSARSQRNKSR